MKKLFEKFLECLSILLPFLRKKDAKQLREFSELITGQYGFLVEQLEKVLKDYFELSVKVRETHAEIFSLKEQLAQALSERCRNKECEQRK